MSADLLPKVEDIARRELAFDGTLQRTQRLVEDLRLDSIQLLTLATAVEDEFEICLDEDDEASIATVGDLLAIVERKLDAPDGDAETAT